MDTTLPQSLGSFAPQAVLDHIHRVRAAGAIGGQGNKGNHGVQGGGVFGDQGIQGNYDPIGSTGPIGHRGAPGFDVYQECLKLQKENKNLRYKLMALVDRLGIDPDELAEEADEIARVAKTIDALRD